ncbi:hypothetical protein TVAG_011480 [Trichomonas vaginalis G3]|uniref:DUF4832 domain-containing protein n=1 Tax=Trichomonas vaginalis (strain ATCC PRA-98 / G3) TaxID=412133 RepID=A2FQM1_TRIV3|nr:glycosyl hydrolase 30 [Trichomonas vaginalis G3]EAX92796.1 hypothetical protein TVAG_011480 [Trichomonas vaginalis G3]KAI5483724.1 glycosyl hydrolase 30 [Trichomonas vaginalis G3]|eukprot:XP_001305726.1 hypothetical protein [Trichomonas vaginalis G3]
MLFIFAILGYSDLPSWSPQPRYDKNGQLIQGYTKEKNGDTTTVNYLLEDKTLLRNPAMGYMIYEEGWSFDGIYGYTPERFWKEIEGCGAQTYNNILYIRLLWGDMEPEEGKYAWLYDDGFKMYIEKAKKYNLKLAFRVFTHGQKAIPQYVKDAGCIMSNQYPVDNNPQPNYDDPIFLEKLEKFVTAFAAYFDDPDLVDFVDSYNTGHWGEGNGPTMRDGSNHRMVVDTVTDVYATHFKKVLTVSTLGDTNVQFMKPLSYEGRGFLQRRDGLGSSYFSSNERNINNDLFLNHRKPLIGESCYWFADGDGSTYTAYKSMGYKDFRDCFTQTITDMYNSHSNTMDMRVPLQCKYYVDNLPDQIQRWITIGGYRLYPSMISYTKDGSKLAITHTWKNAGCGLLPNYHPNWDHKYQVTFALLDKDGKAVYKFTDINAEPGDWYKDHEYSYSISHDVSSSIKGKYTLAVSVSDKTKDNNPGIKLSVYEPCKKGEWLVIDDVEF